MHYLQQKVLHSLTYTDRARFSKLQPPAIASNHFIYHLKQLLLDGLVQKNKDGTYSLSAKGKAYADKVSFERYRPRSQPKIVNLIACKNSRGEYLLYKRKHQPFIDRSGFPYGKLHLGETIKESSERELAEKTHLKAILKHRGEVYVTVYDGEELISHTLFHVHSGYNPIGHLKAESNIGYCYWAKIDPVNSGEYFPGFLEIYNLLRKPSRGRFFADLTFRI